MKSMQIRAFPICQYKGSVAYADDATATGHRRRRACCSDASASPVDDPDLAAATAATEELIAAIQLEP